MNNNSIEQNIQHSREGIVINDKGSHEILFSRRLYFGHTIVIIINVLFYTIDLYAINIVQQFTFITESNTKYNIERYFMS